MAGPVPPPDPRDRADLAEGRPLVPAEPRQRAQALGVGKTVDHHLLRDREMDDAAEHHRRVAERDRVATGTRSRPGSPATRGGVTRRLGSRSRPTSANSSSSGGKSVPVALTASNRCSGARLTTNSPLTSALVSESLRPTEVNCTTGGSMQEIVKKEWGATLSTPSAEVVETKAIGRGMTTAFSSRWNRRRSTSAGSKSIRGLRTRRPAGRRRGAAAEVEEEHRGDQRGDRLRDRGDEDAERDEHAGADRSPDGEDDERDDEGDEEDDEDRHEDVHPLSP